MTVVIDGIEFVPASVAAERLGTTEMKILMLLRQEALCGLRIDESWLVTASSLAGYDPQHAQPVTRSDCHTSCSGSACGCR